MSICLTLITPIAPGLEPLGPLTPRPLGPSREALL